MTLTEQVYTQARLMGQELCDENQPLLEAVCAAAVSTLKLQLRDGIEPEDCLSEFVPAAAMYALAAMNEVGSLSRLEQMTAGDLTLRRSAGDPAADSLRCQAELLMRPYLKSGFAFLGV